MSYLPDQLLLKKEFTSKVFGQSDVRDKETKISLDKVADIVGKTVEAVAGRKA
jgi:hypothetical protein